MTNALKQCSQERVEERGKQDKQWKDPAKEVVPREI